VRFGTEVIVTFRSERVMSVLASVAEIAPPLQPQNANPPATDQKSRPRHKPIMSASRTLAWPLRRRQNDPPK